MNVQATQQSQSAAEIARLVAYARAIGDEDLYRGKRAWPRFSAALQLEATRDPSNRSATWTVSMHTICLGGFAAWSKTEVERHDTFYVREFTCDRERPWLKAVVRHCTRGIRGYLIGAEFENESNQAVADDACKPPPAVGHASRDFGRAHVAENIRKNRKRQRRTS